MKRWLLSCLVSALCTGASYGQVSVTDFQAKINTLNDAIALKNVSKESDAYNALSAAMTLQMGYLASQIDAGKAAYSADNAKAIADSRAADAEATAAQDELVKAIADMNAGKPDAQNAIQKANEDVKKSRNDRNASTTEKQKAQQELDDINKLNANLNTEKKAYADLQPLKTNIPGNADKILAALKSFAATL